MKKKPQKWTVLFVSVSMIALFALLFFGGGGERYSGTRIGYMSKPGRHNWSASYVMLNGSIWHTLRPDSAAAILHMDIETEKGTISIEIKDGKGNVLWNNEDIGTASFDVEVPGKVTVHVKADHHKGSFDMGFVSSSSL